MPRFLFVIITALIFTGTPAFATGEETGGISEYKNVKPTDEKTVVSSKSTADHTKFKELQGPFADGPAVTKACLSCHNKAGKQFMHSLHWTWQYKHPKTGQILGKKTLVNNFCTNARGNEGMCSQCHAAYNHKGPDFDYTNPDNIDCVVCHDQTGTYYRTPATRGHKACSVMFEGQKPIQWTKVAQNVGKPKRANCGTCHFYGGGGDNVKHGDLSSALTTPDKSVDIHMAKDGLNMACQDCHVTSEHITAGSRYQMLAKDLKGVGKPGKRRQAASCESCHGLSPHDKVSGLKGIKLNGHVDKVACETCHIPEFAKGGVATKVDWDWRTAGKLKNGEGYNIKGYTQGNGEHRKTYKSIKGNFKYDENVKPVYAWFDGTMRYTTIDTKFDDSKPVYINSFSGSYNDPKSRIWPFKKMHTIQPYDKGNKTLVYMQLWGKNDAAFWGNYNFQKAIEYGMKSAGKPYSGKYDFIDTYSWWPITHMVAPAKEALACAECHKKNGRLAKLSGFYMPGRDNFWWLDLVGYLMLAGSVLLVIAHTLARIFMKPKLSDHEGDAS